jgi:L-asparagine transporter-like permease
MLQHYFRSNEKIKWTHNSKHLTSQRKIHVKIVSHVLPTIIKWSSILNSLPFNYEYNYNSLFQGWHDGIIVETIYPNNVPSSSLFLDSINVLTKFKWNYTCNKNKYTNLLSYSTTILTCHIIIHNVVHNFHVLELWNKCDS